MKRLVSLVLVSALSFFSFMVYAEDEFPVTDYYLSDVALASFPSDNLGFLPSPLLGTLNLSAGEGIGTRGYAMLNPGSSRINFQPVGSDSPSTPARFVSSGLSSGSSLDLYFGAFPFNDSFYWSLTAGNVYCVEGKVYCFIFQPSVFNSVTFSLPSYHRSSFEILSTTDNAVFVRCLRSQCFGITVSYPSASVEGNYLYMSAMSLTCVGDYSGSSSDFQEWLDNNYQGAVNPGQSGANQEIQDNVGQLEDFDNKIFTDVSDYTSQLDFGLGDWSEAAAGISYIGSIFMLIWDNSPTQVIVLSLMVGLCLLILGRGPRVAGEVRRHEERASRRKKGG